MAGLVEAVQNIHGVRIVKASEEAERFAQEKIESMVGPISDFSRMMQAGFIYTFSQGYDQLPKRHAKLLEGQEITQNFVTFDLTWHDRNAISKRRRRRLRGRAKMAARAGQQV